MSTQKPASDSFEDRVFNHLKAEYPDLDEAFIRRHPKELMDMLGMRDRINPDLGTSLDARARQIPDYLPEDLMESAPPQISEPAQSTSQSAVTNRKHDCMKLLNLFMEKVLNGEISDLCVQAVKTDGNHEMMFTLPANLFAFHGFMAYTISNYLQGGYSEHRAD